MSGAATLILGAICLALGILGQEPQRHQRQQPQQRNYTTKYDGVDIEAVIRNERLLSNYVGCLLDSKPCTPDAAELKANLPDALATNCSGCSETQKRIADRLAHHLIDHRPESWILLEEKYDPSGEYRERYLSEDKDGHDE